MNYSELSLYTGQPEYDKAFWNVMRDRETYDKIAKGRNINNDTYNIPNGSYSKLKKALEKESLFRQIATPIKAFDTSYRIFAKDCDDMAQFIPEGGEIPIYDGLEDFTKITVDSFKLASFVKMDEAFVRDATFPIEDYLIGKFAKNFGRGENNAFINGTGVQMPTGILHDTNGATVGTTTAAITYDDVVNLYFSLKAEYRAKAVWLMNDETAMVLRKLKDEGGNYLWNHNTDTIFGKPVFITEYMPNATDGAKPIAFGDFSYYWLIDRKPVSVRTLTEKFAIYDQIGYLAFEFLDGKLIRPDAVKVLKMTTEASA